MGFLFGLVDDSSMVLSEGISLDVIFHEAILLGKVALKWSDSRTFSE